jgi:hypothetical protein
MGLFEAVIRALIYLGFLVLAFFIVIWFLSVLGISLPPHVVQILMAILTLVAILVLVRLLYPAFSGYQWFPPRNPPAP